MVGPISSADRAAFTLKVKLVLTGVVGVSAALIAVQAGGDLPTVAGALVAGSVVGAGLIWFVFPKGDRGPDAGRRDR